MRKSGWPYLLASLLLLYLFIPIIATLLYSLSSNWHNTILPQELSLQYYTQLIKDSRFLISLGHSLVICLLTLGLSLVTVTPAIIVIDLYLPQYERLLQALCMLPFGIPAVSAAVGLLRAYSSLRTGSATVILIVTGAYFIFILPYMYGGIRNSLRAVNATEIMQAAQLLGAGPGQVLKRILLPNIMPGLLVSTILSLSILLGEYTLVNLLAGGMYETVQIYLYSMMRISGHFSSAIVIVFYLMVLALSIIIMIITQLTGNRSLTGKEESDELFMPAGSAQDFWTAGSVEPG